MKKLLRLLLSLLLVLGIVQTMPYMVYAAPTTGSPSATITYAGQMVDSITYNGMTVNSIFRPYDGTNGYDDTYSCAAFVVKFYSVVYGISVTGMYSTSSIPKASSGSFSETRSPRVGDIVRYNTGTHWAIVKSVDGGTCTLIAQNAWHDDNPRTKAQIGATVASSDTSVSFFTYSGYVPPIPPGYTPIYTAADLNNIRNNMSGKYFLMNDIDVSSLGNWVPLGGYEDYPTPFTGELDGNNHKITGMTMNLAVNYTENHKNAWGGLFGLIGDRGLVKNLGVAGTITATSTKDVFAGGIAAAVSGRIENCYNQVEIHVSAVYNAYVGGIAGQGGNGSAIERCYNVASLSVSPLNTGYGGAYVGGIVGQSVYRGPVTDCYNMGRITAVAPHNALAGGIVGYGESVFTSYNVAQVSATTLKAGGVNSEAYSGGIAGALFHDSPVVMNTYFLSSATSAGIGFNESSGVRQTTGLTDAQMRQQTSFAGFDFDTVWKMPAGGGYPVLRGPNDVASPTTYALTVVNGTGGGNYTADAAVIITANAAPAGQVFDKWTATSGTLADANSASTAFTMPASTATVTATYKATPATTYTLTLNPSGGLVTPPSVTQAQGTTYTLPTPTRAGYEFKGWTLLGNGSLSGNIYTFGAGNATVTAHWEEITQPPLPDPDPPENPPPSIPQVNTIPGTSYEATFFNWILYYVFFGWLWM